MAHKIFITGTDTSIGKTRVSAHFMKAILSKGIDALYVKPFQTGVNSFEHPDSDPWYVGNFCNDFNRVKWLRYFKAPKAPFYAAIDENKIIDIESVLKDISELSNNFNMLVMEGAGGLLVPIIENFFNIDLIKATTKNVLLVARAGLGTINHTLLSLELLKTKGGNPKIVVILNDLDGKTPRDLLIQNADAIQRFGGIKHVYTLPYLRPNEQWPLDMFSSIIEPLL